MLTDRVERDVHRQGRVVAQLTARAAALEELGARQWAAAHRSQAERLRTLAGDLGFSLRRIGQGPRGALKILLSLQAIRASGLFWPDHYTRGRSDLGGLDLVRHYYLWALSEGRDPSPLFSNEAYLRRYPEVARLGYEPLAHYARHGRRQGWIATPVTNLAAYVAPARGRGGAAALGGRSGPLRATWRLAEDRPAAEADLAPYEVRPDDPVILEARRGEAFLSRHRLLGEADFVGAVEALNALGRTAPESADPTVSVIVPVYGQLAYTLNCLDALLAHGSRYSFEIIVVDDASPDETPAHLPGVRAIRYHRQAQNGGFIASSNAGADLARGRILVMLNNDTRVVDGWLDELVETLDADPARGLAGSKLFYPDGSLQEAGGIIWRDGSAWNFGRGDDPNRPEYCYARQVDYVSGASIAVPADLWRRLGGFDTHFAPAYCEDSDLAFRIRDAGLQTWLQPLSRVIHYEGKTSGTDERQGPKAHQVSNRAKLQARWASVLETHRENGREPALEKDRGLTRRVLVIDATAPTPDQDAGSVTTIKVMNVFQGLGFKVTYAPIDNFLFQRKYVGDLQRSGIECLYAPFQATLADHLREHGGVYDVVHIFRHPVMRACIAEVRRDCPKAVVMFNNMDLHYLREQRQAEVESRPDRLPALLEMKREELDTLRQADIIFVPSTHEQTVLAEEAVGRPVEVMPYMVDAVEPVAPQGAQDVVFLGGFAHPPNVDAVEWFLAEIWPVVARAYPAARFVIVGSRPPESFERLRSDRVIVTGRVEDLRRVFESARVFVAPLRFGAGVKGKIYTALSYGAPVVSTAVGVEGTGLVDGEEALVANDPVAFAQAIIRCFSDSRLEDRLRRAGPAFIARAATLAAGQAVMRRVLEQAAQGPRV